MGPCETFDAQMSQHAKPFMNTERIGQYVDLLNKMIKVCSMLAPVVALILRRMGWIDPKKEQPDPLGTAFGVLGFGCLGSIFGLSLTIVLGVGGAIFIGLKFMEAETFGMFSLGSFDWGIFAELFSKTNLIFVGASIVSTLFTFGLKEQPKGIAFLAGGSLGMVFAMMFLLSTFLH